MKKKLLLGALLVTTITTVTKAQTFTNASFETWHNYSVNTGIFPPNPIALTKPDGGWYGVDSLIAFAKAATSVIPGNTIVITPQQQLFKSSLAHSGTSSAEVKSANIGDTIGNIPGVFVNAKINVDITAAAAGNLDDILSLISYEGGTPVTGQVDTVKAWISLDSTANMDEGVIIATTTKMIGDSIAVIGTGTTIVTRGTAAFREFSVPLMYADNTVPEKLIVVFMSSNFAADTIHAGNSMKVDDVSYSYKPGTGVGIRQPLFSESKILVYPNPAKNQIYFNLDATVKPSDFSLAIYDINGRVISKEQLQQAVNSKNVAHWAKGSYFYTLVNDKLNTKEQGKFVVE